MEYYQAFNSIAIYPHHMKQKICGSRAKYRDGKKETAVKVYTINQESVYILITNVPAVGASEELRALCDQYGIVDEFKSLDDYPSEEFTETFLVKYNSFPSARSAKKYLDDKSFCGSVLHVFYAPEFESVYETKMKLQERRKYVAWKIRRGQCTSSNQKVNIPVSNNAKSMKTTSEQPSTQPITYVWAGKEYTVYPSASTSSEVITEDKLISKNSSNVFLPRQLKQKPDSFNYSNTFSDKQSSSSNNLSQVDESSYLNTISNVRNKISNVSVPNVRVSLKRRKRI